jgi:predicted DNA-binding transcriptional regulator AlpA
VRLIDKKGLEQKKGLNYSKTHLDRMMKGGKFPKFIQFDENGKKYWNEDEIDALIAEKLAQRDEVA